MTSTGTGPKVLFHTLEVITKESLPQGSRVRRRLDLGTLSSTFFGILDGLEERSKLYTFLSSCQHTERVPEDLLCPGTGDGARSRQTIVGSRTLLGVGVQGGVGRFLCLNGGTFFRY